jgi:hypothetical protein
MPDVKNDKLFQNEFDLSHFEILKKKGPFANNRTIIHYVDNTCGNNVTYA